MAIILFSVDLSLLHDVFHKYINWCIPYFFQSTLTKVNRKKHRKTNFVYYFRMQFSPPLFCKPPMLGFAPKRTVCDSLFFCKSEFLHLNESHYLFGSKHFSIQFFLLTCRDWTQQTEFSTFETFIFTRACCPCKPIRSCSAFISNTLLYHRLCEICFVEGLKLTLFP